jgi:hypothetical protein
MQIASDGDAHGDPHTRAIGSANSVAFGLALGDALSKPLREAKQSAHGGAVGSADHRNAVLRSDSISVCAAYNEHSDASAVRGSERVSEQRPQRGAHSEAHARLSAQELLPAAVPSV